VVPVEAEREGKLCWSQDQSPRVSVVGVGVCVFVGVGLNDEEDEEARPPFPPEGGERYKPPPNSPICVCVCVCVFVDAPLVVVGKDIISTNGLGARPPSFTLTLPPTPTPTPTPPPPTPFPPPPPTSFLLASIALPIHVLIFTHTRSNCSPLKPLVYNNGNKTGNTHTHTTSGLNWMCVSTLS
jgi:hypothetical protein